MAVDRTVRIRLDAREAIKALEKIRAAAEAHDRATKAQADKIRKMAESMRKGTAATKRKAGALDKLADNLEIAASGYRETATAADASAKAARSGAKAARESARAMRDARGAAKNLVVQLMAIGSAVGGLWSLQRATMASVEAAAELERGQVAVRKTTGLTEASVDRLTESLESLSIDPAGIAVGLDKLLEIAAISGQLGISGRADLEAYTETIARLGQAGTMEGEKAAFALARIQNLTGELAGDVGILGAVITKLGNSTAATESEIASVAARTAQATAAFGLSSTKIAGISAGLAELGFAARAQLPATVIGQLLAKMQLASVEGGAALEDLAAIAGVTGEEFRAAFERDAVEAMDLFIRGVARADKEAIQILQRIGMSGAQALKVIPALAKNWDVMTRSLEIANRESQVGTALMIESSTAVDSLAADLDRAREFFRVLAREVGGELSPVLRELIGELLGNTEAARETAREFGRDLADAVRTLASVVRWLRDNSDALWSALDALMAVQVAAWAVKAATGISTLAGGVTAYVGALRAGTLASQGFLSAGLTPMTIGYGALLAVVIKATMAVAEHNRELSRSIQDTVSGAAAWRDSIDEIRSGTEELTSAAERAKRIRDELLRAGMTEDDPRAAERIAAVDRELHQERVARLGEQRDALADVVAEQQDVGEAISEAREELKRYAEIQEDVEARQAEARARRRRGLAEGGPVGEELARAREAGERAKALATEIAGLERQYNDARVTGAELERSIEALDGATQGYVATARSAAAETGKAAVDVDKLSAAVKGADREAAKLAKTTATTATEAQRAADVIGSKLTRELDAVVSTLETALGPALTAGQRDLEAWEAGLVNVADGLLDERQAIIAAIEATEQAAVAAAEAAETEDDRAAAVAASEAALAELRDRLDANTAAETKLAGAQAQRQAVSAALLAADRAALAEIDADTAALYTMASATYQGEAAVEALTNATADAAAWQRVYGDVLRLTAGDQDAATRAADEHVAALQSLRDAETFAGAWDDYAASARQATSEVSSLVGGMMADLVNDGTVNFDRIWDYFASKGIEAIEEIIQKWLEAELTKEATISAGGGGGAGGGAGQVVGAWQGRGGSINNRPGSTGRSGMQTAGGAGAGGMTAMGVVGIIAAVYMGIQAHERRSRARERSTASTIGYSGGITSGRGVGGAGLSSIDARQLQAELAAELDKWRLMIGGALDFFPEVGVNVRRDGKEFQAILNGVVLGTFDTFEDALTQGMQAGLAGADFSGLGDNMRKALEGLASAATEEQAMSMINMARALDQVGKSNFAVELADGATAWALFAEKVIASGMSLDDAIELRNEEIRLIGGALTDAIEGLIPGTSGAVARFLELRQQAEDYAAALEDEADLRERVANRIAANNARISEGARTGGQAGGGGGHTGQAGGSGAGGGVSAIVAMSTAVGEAGEVADETARQVGAMTDATEGVADAARAATGKFRQGQEEWERGARGLNQDLDAIQEHLREIPDAIPQELVDQAALATLAGELQGLLNVLSEIGLVESNSAEARRVEAELQRLEVLSRLASVRMMVEAVGTLGLITGAWLDEMEQAVASMPTDAFATRGGGGGRGGDRRRRRADLLDEMAAVVAVAGGASADLAAYRDGLAEIIERAAEAERLGIAAEAIGAYVAAALEIERSDFMGGFSERVRAAGETAEETALRQIEAARSAALEQAAALAEAMAAAGLGSVEALMADMAATINAAFDVDVAEVEADRAAAAAEAADAAAAEAEARREATAAAEDQIRALMVSSGRITEYVARLQDLERQQDEMISSYAAELGTGTTAYVLAAGRIRSATQSLIDQSALDMARDLTGWLEQLGVAVDPEITYALAAAEFELMRVRAIEGLAQEAYVEALTRHGIDVAEFAAMIAGLDFSELRRSADRSIRRTSRAQSSFGAMSDRAVDDLARIRAEMAKMIFGWTRTQDPVIAALQDIGLQLAEVTQRYVAAGGAVADLADLEAAAAEARRRVLEAHFEQLEQRITERRRTDPRVSETGRLGLMRADLQELFAAIQGGDISKLGDFLALEAAIRQQLESVADVSIGQGADITAALDAMLEALRLQNLDLDPDALAAGDPAYQAMLDAMSAASTDASQYYATATAQRGQMVTGINRVQTALAENNALAEEGNTASKDQAAKLAAIKDTVMGSKVQLEGMRGDQAARGVAEGVTLAKIGNSLASIDGKVLGGDEFNPNKSF